MDAAVAMVRAFLQANGYFTMTEAPVIEIDRAGALRTATDLDILAVRFPGERRFIAGNSSGHGDRSMRSADADLDHAPGRIELIIGEVKEGRAELNAAATDPGVLRVALYRFGAFDEHEVPSIVHDLIATGTATRTTPCHGDIRVRIFSFGSTLPDRPPGRQYTIFLHRQILRYFSEAIRDHREVVPYLNSRDPFISALLLMYKARQESPRHQRRPDPLG